MSAFGVKQIDIARQMGIAQPVVHNHLKKEDINYFPFMVAVGEITSVDLDYIVSRSNGHIWERFLVPMASNRKIKKMFKL